MFDERDVTALLLAYIDGDTLARKVLIDALEEADDPRVEQFREEAIDWDNLAEHLSGEGAGARTHYPSTATPRRSVRLWRGEGAGARTHYPSTLSGESARMRFRIDCARFGSPTTPEVTKAVQRARHAHAKKLFPELEL